ncbi:class I SAM-dependent methyltransferase [Vibrio profundum]|uniref:class I SAM-dependent methyltransferase n=1 Tax=Vibrio profundum TaxID=2910247 RepID=UPI003D0D2CE9
MGMSFTEPEKLTLIFDAENREEWQRTSHVLNCLSINSEMTVADIGAGTGYFSNIFAGMAKKVHAIDCESNMVRYMQNRFADSQHGNIKVTQSTLADPCIPEGVDLVFIANTYRFIQDRVTFLQNLWAQVSSQAQLIIVDFKGENARVSPQMAAAEVEQAGFSIVNMDMSGCPDHYVMELAKAE